MLATPASSLPTGEAWTYEIKWDGYRALAAKDGPRVRLVSRNQKDLTRDYPTVVAAVARIGPRKAVLDGEIVALDSNGRPSFQALQHRSTGNLALVYYAFDLLSLEGELLTHRPLTGRRAALMKAISASRVLLSEPLEGDVRQIEQAIRQHGLEGVVAKRCDSVYRPGQRTEAWVKVKFSPQQEFVIGGYKPEGATFDSVLVGYYDKRRLCFAGKVRAGFTPHLRAEILARIAKRPRTGCPFVNLPNSSRRSRWGEGITAEEMKTLRWVQPSTVIEVAFVEWTREGLLRHSRFVGLRQDKRPTDVHRETP
jgi:bifunctional non-homologous end joining protein LigD